jgi:transposase-like protein
VIVSFVDETYVKVNGLRHVHRSIDQHGQVIDVPVPPTVTLQRLAGSSNERSQC